MAARSVRWLALASAVAVGFVTGAVVAASAVGEGSLPRRASPTTLPGFDRAVFLGHVNDPDSTPGFPGDPAFTLRTLFTVPDDGFYLQVMKEGEHTGTHHSAPCHFHEGALCADELAPGDFVLPAVVIDVREQVAADVDYEVTVRDLQAWIAENGPMPKESAVIAWTGCARWWGPQSGAGVPSYYNCGSGRRGFHQPGFSEYAVRWLIDQGILGERGALGTDTFGPDPGTDPNFVASSLTLRKHRLTLENLSNLGLLPPAGGWIVIGGPRNAEGSGAPSTILGLAP
jgi:kynurenine formamidase